MASIAFPETTLRPAAAAVRPSAAAPLQILTCEDLPGLRVELWGGGVVASRQTTGCNVDALRFHLEDCPSLKNTVDDLPEILPHCPAGSCSMFHYGARRQWRGAPASMIVFRMPRDALVEWARANGHERYERLHFESGVAFNDPVLANLAHAMHRSFTDDTLAAPAFTAMIFEAVLTYVVKTFGTSAPEKHRGGLAGWQMRSIQAAVADSLQDQVPLSELADLCGLSVSYFVKAFRVTTGETPHQWLISRRIDRARELLMSPSLSLADVAATCGFSDQSHFTRTFTKSAGVSPGAWRKEARSAAQTARRSRMSAEPVLLAI